MTNAVHLANKEIEVTYDPAVGWDATSYKQPRASDTEPVILPWGQVKSQTFKFDGTKFAKASEVAQQACCRRRPGDPDHAGAALDHARPRSRRATDAPCSTPAAISPSSSSRTTAPIAARSEVRPQASTSQVHVDGDPRPERVVLLVGRDIVVFGPGFKGGNAYAYITLSQFADAGDIEEMTARDLTGDGAADLVVRGVRHVSAQGAGTIDMHVMFVYQLKNEVITRVFGIETARAPGPEAHPGPRADGARAAATRASRSTSAPGAHTAGRTRRIRSRRTNPARARSSRCSSRGAGSTTCATRSTGRRSRKTP